MIRVELAIFTWEVTPEGGLAGWAEEEEGIRRSDWSWVGARGVGEEASAVWLKQ